MQTWNNVGTDTQTFTFRTDTLVSADQIQVALLNSQWDPDAGIDENLLVDRIEIDGEVFETEDPSTFSTATWKPEDGITPGFRQSEALNHTGYFQYAAGATPPPPPQGDGDANASGNNPPASGYLRNRLARQCLHCDQAVRRDLPNRLDRDLIVLCDACTPGQAVRRVGARCTQMGRKIATFQPLSLTGILGNKHLTQTSHLAHLLHIHNRIR